ncbi:efflux transporter outer membrane subunit [Chitinimonas sp. BJYL2]|uniref:efflux transporter outer membrane subunit n=1 Tax=Chitinimonas sp. BJYL2 TaxID=2976696 RepID=UPI0022B44238|nr:efflux transporter outer membrane subunit [Chitinimonas sp. BJYL2]
MKSKNLQHSLLAVTLAAALAGCATAVPPAVELPQHRSEQAAVELDAWWTSFNDPTLTALIDEALAHNADVQTALTGVEQSKATLREARVALLPDASLSLTSSRQNPSNEVSQPGQAGVGSNHRGGIAISYELDLWGRVWKAKDAAAAMLLASEYAKETTRAAVAAQTAKSYFALLALDANEALLTQTLATRDESLAIANARYKVGAIGDYELKLAETERAAVAAALPKARAGRVQAEAALAVLLGRNPKDVVEGRIERGNGLTKLAEAPEIPVGLSSDLLQRRPDVKRAEAQYAYAEALLGEARRRYFPSLSLTGFAGGESASLSNLLDAPARTWNIAASLLQPIVGMARIDAQVDAAKSRKEAADIAYAQAARAAYGDARAALAGHRGARESLAATQVRAEAQNRVKVLTEQRYKAGVSSYLDLLNAERDRLAAERDHVSALQDRVDALVTVYQALGGGWPGTRVAKAD